jgi:hypothetical protein
VPKSLVGFIQVLGIKKLVRAFGGVIQWEEHKHICVCVCVCVCAWNKFVKKTDKRRQARREGKKLDK